MLRNNFVSSLFLALSLTLGASSALADGADTCELLSKGPGVDLTSSEVNLHQMLDSFLKDLKAGNFEHLTDYFHPVAKVPSTFGEKLKAIIDQRYEGKHDFTIFRVWRLTAPNADKPVFANCPENDGAKIIGSFGYKKQFVVWIQIMAENELGRLLLSVAPDKDKTKIVGLRIEQATESGQDWRAWAAKGEAAEAAKNTREAYVDFDIAQKLIDGKDFVVYPVQMKLLERRDALYTQPKLIEAINKDLGVDSMAYVGTLLAKEGSGLFLREFLKKELTANETTQLCVARGRALQKAGWLTSAQGVRCNFLYKGMDPRKDSALGGIYLTPEDLRNTKK